MRPNSRRIFGLARKETWQIVRDPSSIIIAAFLPLTLLFLFGYGVTFDPRHYDIGLVVEQPTPETGSFTASLINSSYFQVETARHLQDLEDKMVAGELKGIVVLRADFSRQAFRGDTAPLQILVDGTDANTAELIRSYVQALWASWLRQELLSNGVDFRPPIVLEPRLWFNPEASSKNYLVPGSVAIIMTMIGALLTALVVAREWERGTMEALLTTPIGRWELLLGKLAPYFVLGMISMVLSVATAIWLFEVPFRGSFLLLAMISAVFMWASLGLGLFISTISPNQLIAAQISILSAFLPAFYFSNFVFEIDSMPVALQWVSYIVPAKYFVSTLQTLFLVGNVPELIALDTAVIGLIGLVFFGLTVRKTRMRLE